MPIVKKISAFHSFNQSITISFVRIICNNDTFNLKILNCIDGVTVNNKTNKKQKKYIESSFIFITIIFGNVNVFW